MQIKNIVHNATSRFSVLLVEEKQIQAFLTQALTTYQEMAGCLRTMKLNSPNASGISLPESFLAHAMCKDDEGNYVSVHIEEQDDGTVSAIPEGGVYPLTYEYLVNLAYYADKPDLHIPNRISGVITDYLECLVGIENDSRLSRVETSGKMDTSHLPSVQDRTATKAAIEEQFRNNRASISMASIHPI